MRERCNSSSCCILTSHTGRKNCSDGDEQKKKKEKRNGGANGKTHINPNKNGHNYQEGKQCTHTLAHNTERKTIAGKCAVYAEVPHNATRPHTDTERSGAQRHKQLNYVKHDFTFSITFISIYIILLLQQFPSALQVDVCAHAVCSTEAGVRV